MRMLILPALLALTGCATAGSLDTAEPKFSYTTQKTPDQLEQCIGLALSSAGSPGTIRGPGRRIMDYNMGGISAWTVTISDGPPVLVEMRWSMPMMAAKWKNRVRGCA